MVKSFKKNISVLVFSLIFLILFFITFILIKLGIFQKTDELINSYFLTSSNQMLTNLFLFVSFVFEPLSLIIISLIVSFLLFLNKLKKESLFFLIVPLVGGILIIIFKEIFQRVRPENLIESGFSFPSGHATISVILFGSLVYFSFKHIKGNSKYLISFFSFILLLIVFFSRIYLGVHWFSDLLGGGFLGMFVFLFAIYFFEKSK